MTLLIVHKIIGCGFLLLVSASLHAAEVQRPGTAATIKSPSKVQPRPESGPFGNVLTKPSALAPSILTLSPVEGALVDDALLDFKVLPAFSNGRLIYFTAGTLQQTKVPIAESKNTSKTTAPATRLIQGYFLVERTFIKDKAPVVKLYQVRGSQKIRAEVPRFFPDGKKLFFQVDDGSRGPNSYRLYVVNLDDKSAKRLELDAIAIREVAISPDSRYIAVTGAGAMSEKGWNPQAAPQLFVYDLQTNKSRDLLKGDLYNRLPLGIAWTGENKLLFSLAPKEEPAPPKTDDKSTNIRLATANALVLSTIYEATAEGEPQRLFSGYNALPSPDGKWLSFIGQMDVNQPNYLMPHICLFDRKTLKRYTGLPGISHALWSPDSRHLVIGESHRQAGVPHLRLYSVGLDKWQTQEITSLPLQSPNYLARAGAPMETNVTVEKAKSVKVAETAAAKETAKPASTRPPFPAQWKPLLISPDGSTLYAQIKTYSAPDKRGLSTEVWNLQAVNLRDGTTSLLSALPGASGVAWLPGTLN